MQKRIKRQAVCEDGRTVRWMAAAVVVGLFILAGWWLFGGGSSLRVRAAGLQKISVIVDRLDELSTAWKGRSTPPVQHSDKGGNDASAQSKPNTDTKPPAAPANGGPAAGVQAPPASNEPDVSKEDQEQLHKLLHEINKQ